MPDISKPLGFKFSAKAAIGMFFKEDANQVEREEQRYQPTRTL